jgi:hypothetical protein
LVFSVFVLSCVTHGQLQGGTDALQMEQFVLT